PYGDVWKILRELCYKKHPYRWLTIGRELSHIEKAKLEDVKSFFFEHYNPTNAILVVGGNVKTDEVKRLAEKWFGELPAGKKYDHQVPPEPAQTAARLMEVTEDVPLDALFKCYPIYPRLDPRYYVVDLIADILAGGNSSRLYQILVKEKKLFSSIDCYHFGSLDAGLITVEGKLIKGVKMQDADKAVEEILQDMGEKAVSEEELQKVKNGIESLIAFEDMSLLGRCNNLAFYELLGDAALMNDEMKRYATISVEDIRSISQKIFTPSHRNTLYYFAKNQLHDQQKTIA
ncbi:MAG: M16 family metallopeptidase, partial [Chitinophagaceae bacterium]